MDEVMKKNWQTVELIVFCTLIIIGFLIGYQTGYSKAYTYVKDYEEEFMEQNCMCTEPQQSPQQNFFNMTEITKALKNSS